MTKLEYDELQDFLQNKIAQTPNKYLGNYKVAYDSGVLAVNNKLKSMYFNSINKETEKDD